MAALIVGGVVTMATPVQADWRPCGPGGCLNWFIPQGAYGADFRPACARHDACYVAGCNRAQCDRQFYNDMCSACQCADHPMLCRCRAKCFYVAVRLFGGGMQGKGGCGGCWGGGYQGCGCGY